VSVRTEKNHLGTAEHQLPIIPGMVATVEILTYPTNALFFGRRARRLGGIKEGFVQHPLKR
jgi:adhesin transport system membrane fusion protein